MPVFFTIRVQSIVSIKNRRPSASLHISIEGSILPFSNSIESDFMKYYFNKFFWISHKQWWLFDNHMRSIPIQIPYRPNIFGDCNCLQMVLETGLIQSNKMCFK